MTPTPKPDARRHAPRGWTLPALLVISALLVPAAAQSAEDPSELVLETVNRQRLESGLVPLEADATVDQVVRDLAVEVTRLGRLDPVSVDAVSAGLEASGYRPRQVVLGYAQGQGDFSWLLEQWRQADPGTFERLLEPELRHFALGVGDARGVPVYLAVGAVSVTLQGREAAERLGSADEVRAGVLEAVNRERVAAGLVPLRADSRLHHVAQDYADAMLERGFYGHRSPDGRDVLDRVRAAGYAARRVGENLAKGQTTVEQVMAGWMASPEHRSNLLHPRFRELGVGLAAGATDDGDWDFLWVQVFATPR